MPSDIIETGRKVLDAKLAPCGRQGVGPILSPLMVTLKGRGTDGMSEQNAAAYYSVQADRYAVLLEHVPAKILEAACIAHERVSDWFPTAHELLKHCEPEMEKLGWQRRWLDKIPVAGKNPPKVVHDFEPEPEEVRLRTAIERGHKYRNGFMGENLWRSAIRAEIRLAEIEGRQPADWAKL